MYILYADESGNTGADFDNVQQPIFVLGGVLVNENNWHKINRLLDDEKVKIDPYLHSFSELYTAICKNMKDKKSNSIIFLDKQLNFNKELANFFPEIQQKYVDNIIEYPMFLDSDSTNYIQIADILSFYVNKYYSIKNGYQKYGEKKEKHCLEMFKKLSKNTIISIKNFE